MLCLALVHCDFIFLNSSDDPRVFEVEQKTIDIDGYYSKGQLVDGALYCIVFMCGLVGLYHVYNKRRYTRKIKNLEQKLDGLIQYVTGQKATSKYGSLSQTQWNKAICQFSILRQYIQTGQLPPPRIPQQQIESVVRQIESKEGLIFDDASENEQ